MKVSTFQLNVSARYVSVLISSLGLAAASGCHPQNQDEVQQLRAEVAALSAEVEALKAKQAEAPAPAATPAPTAEQLAAAPPAPPPKPPWEEQIKAFKAESRDKSWARLREAPLLKAATQHIKGSGASLQSVSCKTTACLVVVDVPQKTRKPYKPFANPWAETDLTIHTKPTYGGRTRWSYLLSRHDKDYAKFGAERVDPLKLAQEGGKTREAVAATSAPAKSEDKTPSDKAPAQAAPAPKTAAKSQKAAPKTAAKPASAKKTATQTPPPAPKAAPAKPAGKAEPAKAQTKTASKAPPKAAASPKAVAAPEPKSKPVTNVAAAEETPPPEPKH